MTSSLERILRTAVCRIVHVSGESRNSESVPRVDSPVGRGWKGAISRNEDVCEESGSRCLPSCSREAKALSSPGRATQENIRHPVGGTEAASTATTELHVNLFISSVRCVFRFFFY